MRKILDANMNILKIVAILFVILLHVNANNIGPALSKQLDPTDTFLIIFCSIFTRIGVPLFVLISGRYVIAGVAGMTNRDYYTKRLPRLFIPLVTWSLVYFVICLLIVPETTWISFTKDFASGFAYNYTAIHLWYLYMLLGLYLSAPLLYQRLRRFTFLQGVYFGIALCLFGAAIEIVKNLTATNLWVFWWLEFIGLFSLGYVLRDLKSTRKKFFLLGGALLIEGAATLLSFYLAAQGNILAGLFHWGLTFNAQTTAVLLYLFFNSCKFESNLIARFSSYTLGIYLFHPIIIFVIMKTFTTSSLVLEVFLKTALTYVISLACIFALSKIKFLKRILQ